MERRYPAAHVPSDTARASLSVDLAQGTDSLGSLPPRSMISVLIAGPSAAEHPDTVRLITAEEPNRPPPLWRGDQLRPGTYSASLTTQGYAAGPHEFALAPGERVEIEVTMHHDRECTSGPAR